MFIYPLLVYQVLLLLIVMNLNMIWGGGGEIHFVECITNFALKTIFSQWVWFSMSTRNFIGSGQNSAHPLLGDRWIARSAITQGSCVFNAYVHHISHDMSVRK